jgi:hypothetical protein
VLAHVEAEGARRAAGGLDKSEQRVEGRRLAGTVRAEQANHLALMDAERESVEGERVPIALGELLELQHWSRGAGAINHRANHSRPIPYCNTVACVKLGIATLRTEHLNRAAKRLHHLQFDCIWHAQRLKGFAARSGRME